MVEWFAPLQKSAAKNLAPTGKNKSKDKREGEREENKIYDCFLAALSGDFIYIASTLLVLLPTRTLRFEKFFLHHNSLLYLLTNPKKVIEITS